MDKSISLLFLTNTNIIHKNAFNDYVQNCEIFIHPKNPQKVDKIWQKNIITNLVKTQWGDRSIVMATLNLLKAAIQKGAVQWFILCSEDMYPLMTYQQLNEYLQTQTKSIFQIMEEETNKTSQFWTLSRTDVETILKKQEYNEIIFKKIPPKASFDERYFLNLLKHENPNYEFTDSPICYVKWLGGGIVAKHPTIFNCLLPNDIEIIQEKKCCFIRKTNKYFRNEPCPMKEYNILIVHGTKSPLSYTKFVYDFKDLANIFVLCLKDGVTDKDLMRNARQTYFSVWSMVEEALQAIQIAGNLVIVKEEYDLQNLKSVLMGGKQDPLISANFDTTTILFPSTQKNAVPIMNANQELLNYAVIESDDIYQSFQDNLDLLYDFSSDMKDKLNAYYRLKSKYEQHVQLTNVEKKAESKVHLCVSCKQPGGTLFFQKYTPETGNLLGAKCNATKPCNLDIIVESKQLINCHQQMAKLKQTITRLKGEIVFQKNNDMFGLRAIDSTFDTLIEQINENYSDLDEYVHFAEIHDKHVDFVNLVERLEKAIFNCVNNVDKSLLQTAVLRSLYEFTKSDLYNRGYVMYNQLTVCNYYIDQLLIHRNILIQSVEESESGGDKQKIIEMMQIITRLHQLFTALKKYKYANTDLRLVASKMKKEDKKMDKNDNNDTDDVNTDVASSNDDFFSVFAIDKPHTNKHRLSRANNGGDINPIILKWETNGGVEMNDIQRFENILQKAKVTKVKNKKNKTVNTKKVNNKTIKK